MNARVRKDFISATTELLLKMVNYPGTGGGGFQKEGTLKLGGGKDCASGARSRNWGEDLIDFFIVFELIFNYIFSSSSVVA